MTSYDDGSPGNVKDTTKTPWEGPYKDAIALTELTDRAEGRHERIDTSDRH
jgi:hypothetical protein